MPRLDADDSARPPGIAQRGMVPKPAIRDGPGGLPSRHLGRVPVPMVNVDRSGHNWKDLGVPVRKRRRGRRDREQPLKMVWPFGDRHRGAGRGLDEWHGDGVRMGVLFRLILIWGVALSAIILVIAVVAYLV